MEKERIKVALIFLVIAAALLLSFKFVIGPALNMQGAWIAICWPFMVVDFLICVTRKCWTDVWC